MKDVIAQRVDPQGHHALALRSVEDASSGVTGTVQELILRGNESVEQYAKVKKF